MPNRRNNRWGKAALTAAASTLAIMAATPAALAQEPAVATAQQQVNIPAGPLEDALITVSETFGVTVIAPNELVSGKSSPVVSGRFNAEQTIDRLLAASGLQIDRSSSGAYVVTQIAAEVRPAQPAWALNEARGEIVVIGSRFQNSLINRLPVAPEEFPFSLDLIDDELIEERGFFNPQDILQTIPNTFQAQNEALPSGALFFIRGFEASRVTNNRPEGNSRGAGQREISFIERIEVAKGPTSIILGPVIPGGVVNLVTKTPKNNDFLDVTFRAGSFETYRAEVDGNASSLFGSEKLKGRVTIAYEDRGSPQDPAQTETFAVRPVVEFDLTDRTRIQASAAYTSREGILASLFPVNADGSVPDGIDPDTYVSIPPPVDAVDRYYDAELQHEFLDNLKLVVRGSYQETDIDYTQSHLSFNYAGARGFEDGDTIATTYLSRISDAAEVSFVDTQLVGGFDAFGQRNDWVIGTGYRNEKSNREVGFGAAVPIDITDFAATVIPATNDPELAPFNFSETDLYSLFGEAVVRPTDRLTILAGIRYDEITRIDFSEFFGRDSELTSEDVTFRIGATYEITSGFNAYASYAESFVPQNGTIRTGESIEPETATNYEVGLKGQVLNGKVNINAAAFALVRQDVATQDPANDPVLGERFVVAGGEQEHLGFELSVNADVTEAFVLNASYGYVDTEVTESNDTGGFFVIGQTVPRVPSHTFNVFANYTLQQGVMEGLKMGAGARGISERPAPQFNIEYDGYVIVDAFASYRLNDYSEIQVNALNLLNEEYREAVGYGFGSPGGGHQFGNPRGIYGTLRLSF
ncbi:MAG: TonB-dependent receptor [Pseudomonadota bacterium]